MSVLGALAEVTPELVRTAVALVRDGIVIDLGVPLDATLLPSGDPDFNQPIVRSDVMTPEGWNARLRTGNDGFHLDAIAGSIHQGTHLDALVHVVSDGRVFGDRDAVTSRTSDGWSFGGVETVPPIVTRGVLIDVIATRDGVPLGGAAEVTVEDVDAALPFDEVDPTVGQELDMDRSGPVADRLPVAHPGRDRFMGPTDRHPLTARTSPRAVVSRTATGLDGLR